MSLEKEGAQGVGEREKFVDYLISEVKTLTGGTEKPEEREGGVRVEIRQRIREARRDTRTKIGRSSDSGKERGIKILEG